MLVIAGLALGYGSAVSAQPPGPPPATQPAPYDEVGYAVFGADGATVVAHPVVPPGSFAEITALDSGRTLLVPIGATARAGRDVELPPPVAQELGIAPGQPVPVRVRAAQASPADLAALRSGRAAVARADAPPVLLTALRRKLTGAAPRTSSVQDAKPSPARPETVKPPVAAKPAPIVRSGPGYYVQIAALSDPARARAVANVVGGAVSAAGRLHRVRLGPFADQRSAQAARDVVARRGYGDARIVRE